MTVGRFYHYFSVISLTLCATWALSGRSLIASRYKDTCKSHAYVQSVLSDYITKRYYSGAPVRMAIIPFSAAANVAAQNYDVPGLGNLVVRRVQAKLLQEGQVPIVELINRQDWPGKKEEFFTGNFGALAQAYAAGYDLVMVGTIDPQFGLDNLSASTKVIEVSSGTTLWYGETLAHTDRDRYNKYDSMARLADRRPDRINYHVLVNLLGRCVVNDVLADRTVPE